MSSSGTAILGGRSGLQEQPEYDTGVTGRLGVVALIATAPASIGFLSFTQGGFFPSSTGLAAIGFAAVLVLRTTLTLHPFEGYNRRVGTLLLALAFLALWQLASSLWSHDPARALDDYDRTLLYLLALALFGSLPRTQLRLRWLIRSIAAAMTAIALAGLISRVLPHVWPTALGFYADRLSFPLSYWNAEGFLAAIAAIALLHIAASDEEHPIARVLAAAFFPAVAATLLLTFSRGALAVGALGAVVYLGLGRPRAWLGAAVALAPTTAVSIHAAYGATLLASNRPTSPAAVAQGQHVAVVVGVCMLGAGAARAVMLLADSALERALGHRPLPRRLRQGLASAAVSAGVIAAIVLFVTGFVSREVGRFANPPQRTALTRDRLTDVSGNNRVELWRLALQDFTSRPLIGHGAGTYAWYYARHRNTTVGGSVRDAHNLYLQTLAELGIIGFIPIAILVLGVLRGLAVGIRGPARGTYAVLFAGALAWAIHAGLDWDWEMPAVTLWLFMTAGLALAQPSYQLDPKRDPPRNRTPMALGWLVLAVAPLLVGVSYERVGAAGAEFSSGSCVAARRTALSSISLLSDRPEPYELLTLCDLQLGFPAEGLGAAEKAVGYEPQNWNYHYGLALAQAEDGLDPRAEAARALALNPLEPIVQDAVATFSTGGTSVWQRDTPSLLLGALESGRLVISTL